jgi:hypothetical protein
MERKKPKCRLTGTDGNVFALGGKVAAALERAGLDDEAREFAQRLFGCQSYTEALKLMQEYVDVS